MQDDSQIISKVQNGSEHAFSILYDKYSGAIYSVILKMTRDEDTAQDLLQETFISIWEKSKQYNPEKGRFYTWAYRIARHKVLNYLRQTNKLIQTEDFSVYNKNEEPEDLSSELMSLKGAILKLETHHRNALDLVYFKGLTHKEAHKAMNVPLGTFKSYVQQAMRELRNHYKTLAILIALFIKIQG